MIETLQQLGMTENEAQIFIALSGTQGLSISQLTQKTQLSRPYLYDALSRMQEKQFVSFLRQDGRKVFKAADPVFLEEMACETVEMVRNIMRDLEKRKPAEEGINAELHRGKQVFNVLLKDILSTVGEGEEILIFGIDDDVILSLDKYANLRLQQYFARIERKNISERVIVRHGARILPEATPSRYRFLPAGTIGNTAFEVYADRVAIFFWGSENHLILIKNKDVAESYKNQFEILWKAAEKVTTRSR